VTIQRFEQSGFIFETDEGQRLALDIGSFTPIEKLEKIAKVDGFLVSHIHYDHFSIDHIKALLPNKVLLNSECLDAIAETESSFNKEHIAPGKTAQLGGYKINSYEADHGPNTGGPVAENQSFVIEADGKKIYFAGDMFYPSGLEPDNINVDLALIPVGTHYTFGPQEALDYVEKFARAGTVVPIHNFLKPETAQKFIDLVGNRVQTKLLNVGDSFSLS
jgi:L-ascorbate metabolism protein UlaG (beta-lactamase superfamily)